MQHKITASVENYQLYKDYIEYIKRDLNFSSTTIDYYDDTIRKYVNHIGTQNIREITLMEVSEYFGTLKNSINGKPLKVSSLNTIRCILRSFFQYVDRYREIRMRFDYSMIKQARAPRPRIEPPTLEEVRSMIAKAATKQDKLMLITMFSTGLRISELANLQVKDFRTNELYVRGKGCKDRTIPIDEQLSLALQQHMLENRIFHGTIFRSTHGGAHAFRPEAIRKRFRKQLGDSYKSPHKLRHGYATLLLTNGMDIRTLQTALGHSNIQTTMLYTHITDTHLRESHKKYWPSSQFKVSSMVE